MSDFLNNGSIIFLLGITMCGALLFGLVLVWAVAKRRQKNQPPAADISPQENVEADVPPPTAVPDAVNLSLLSNTPPGKVENSLPTPAPTPNPPPIPANEPSSHPEELLRLLRQPHTDQLILEVGGQRYTKLTDVVDKKIGQFILKLTAHLLAFTNGVILTPNGIKNLGAPLTGQLPLLPVDNPPRPAATPLPPPTPPPVLPSQPRNRGFLGRNRTPAEPAPTLNLADEINDIVQAKLLDSPLARDNRIDITSDHSGGIRITVNGQYYATLDDVQNPEIRRLIQESIKEWERR